LPTGPQGHENQDEIKGYVSGYNLDVDGVGVVDFKSFGVPGTPVLIVTDRHKIVRGVWLGRVQPHAEDNVVSMVERVCAE
jgi:hypothetical protein